LITTWEPGIANQQDLHTVDHSSDHCALKKIQSLFIWEDSLLLGLFSPVRNSRDAFQIQSAVFKGLSILGQIQMAKRNLPIIVSVLARRNMRVW
jgi:hypothetical protein